MHPKSEIHVKPTAAKVNPILTRIFVATLDSSFFNLFSLFTFIRSLDVRSLASSLKQRNSQLLMLKTNVLKPTHAQSKVMGFCYSHLCVKIN